LLESSNQLESFEASCHATEMQEVSNPSNSPEVPNEGADWTRLDACERGVVEIFVSVALVLGFARSLGEIYGLSYISQGPIHLAEVCDRLQMSKGSASQGLRTLRDLGALKPVYIVGDRRDYFEPEVKIRVLLHRLLSDRLRPHMDRSEASLKQLNDLVEQSSDLPPDLRKFRVERITLLRAWQKRVSMFLPLLQRILR
jgi:DNA-binding transcriptional regulator GbsR (MarR family)